MARDFTDIDDIVDGVVGVLDRPPAGGENRLLNIGDCNPVGLMDMIAMLERTPGRPAIKLMRPMQPGDVTATYADISAINAPHGYRRRKSAGWGTRVVVRVDLGGSRNTKTTKT